MPAYVDPKKCTGCETCVAECPSGAISMKEGVAVVDESKCTDCETCVSVCPSEAISMKK